jgi:hypothetical protein
LKKYFTDPHNAENQKGQELSTAVEFNEKENHSDHDTIWTKTKFQYIAPAVCSLKHGLAVLQDSFVEYSREATT